MSLAKDLSSSYFKECGTEYGLETKKAYRQSIRRLVDFLDANKIEISNANTHVIEKFMASNDFLQLSPEYQYKLIQNLKKVFGVLAPILSVTPFTFPPNHPPKRLQPKWRDWGNEIECLISRLTLTLACDLKGGRGRLKHLRVLLVILIMYECHITRAYAAELKMRLQRGKTFVFHPNQSDFPLLLSQRCLEVLLAYRSCLKQVSDYESNHLFLNVSKMPVCPASGRNIYDSVTRAIRVFELEETGLKCDYIWRSEIGRSMSAGEGSDVLTDLARFKHPIELTERQQEFENYEDLIARFHPAERFEICISAA